MLQQFSWGHFLVTAAVFSLVWYLWVLLVCYRMELLAFLGRLQGVGDDRAMARTGTGTVWKSALKDDQLMGASKLPDGVELCSSAQVSFSASEGDGRYDQVGLVADVLEELKLIFSEVERSGGGKAFFLDRVAGLVEDYGRIAGHPSIGSIHAFIRERAPFALTDAELDQLWY